MNMIQSLRIVICNFYISSTLSYFILTAALRLCVPIHLDYQCTICQRSQLQDQEGDPLP